MRQILFALVIGVIGTGVLVRLGLWQLARLEWKEELIADAAAMMAQPSGPLPAKPDPGADRYRPVTVSGTFTGDEVHILSSTREKGPGFRIITAFWTEDHRRIMVDRGFVAERDRDTPRPGHAARITGNLNWPDDVTSSTPAPDIPNNMWFGRDVPAMALYLKAEPVLIIASEDTGDGIMVQPATAAFRNDHLGYAVTWFGLALVWAGMTIYWLWRIRTRKV